ncbi:hypothetical protein Lal_00003922 [Lupinus albus]|nr:hypothetical protein Lal_00003922 [Lupinus albus]
MPLIGCSFTWYKPEGGIMSRLDRFFLFVEWLLNWPDSTNNKINKYNVNRGDLFAIPNSTQWAVDRDCSNHCPIVLRPSIVNRGPSPFRLNNCWFLHHGFKELVIKTWRESEVFGWSAFVVKEKLKFLKVKLKDWNREVFTCLDSKLSDLVKKIQLLDIIGEASILL